jgi:hypothetical protein
LLWKSSKMQLVANYEQKLKITPKKAFSWLSQPAA